MSLETSINTLNATILAFMAQLQQGGGALAAQTAAATVPAAPAYVPAQAPVAAPAAPTMPPPPSFLAATAPAAPSGGAPFSDTAGIIEYSTQAYAALEAKGQGRGQNIANVLAQLGCDNLGALPAAQYGAFYQMMEQMKAQP